jgi:hypothetical protein
MNAVSTRRDIIAFAECTETPVFVLSLDLAQAFDRISHQYLFRNLQAYGIGSWIVEHVEALYSNAMACGTNSGQERHTIRMSLDYDPVCTMHTTATQ